eukprot:CAMPEP_0178506372 /NCGR_PEP_ID=MMETSP0696-20121128/19639_1 /TAXON_ID=265572 /ORGANISM="Extubocellulus spinifer, Strain CCMP396" /LENGTH=1075 /DNA_ID=CAMNT_0020135765 /DNA_START=446 /DNA_END=3674 /DNA_ORIENTATION=+
MSSSYCLAASVLSLSLLGTNLVVQGQDIVDARPLVAPPALRRLRNNGSTRPQAGDIWHRFVQQQDTTTNDGTGTPQEDGTEFVNLLRQTSPQYVMEQHRDVFDEMLSRAFTDISAGFNSIPPPTEVPRLPGSDTAVPTMQPTVIGLDPEDDAVVTTAGVPVTIAVLSNDSINGAEALPVAPLVLGAFTQPDNGVVTANPDGTTLQYTPDDLYTNCPDPAVCDPVIPVDCFRYESCDQEDVCVWADVCIEVTPYTGPEPVEDVVTTVEGTAVTLDVLANDVSPTGEPLRLGSFTQPQNGLARPSPDGTTIEYTPNDLYTNCVDPVVCDPVIPAAASSTSRVCDQDGVCVLADVCVEVDPYNGPEPIEDVATTIEGTAVTLDVLANDVSPTGEPLRLGTFTQPQNGLARLSPDGTTIEYTPNDLYTNCVDPVACDPVVPADCFQYQACDEADVCVWADVCVEVNAGVPQPEDDTSVTTENTAVTLDVLANDVSPTGEPLRLGTFTQPQNGLARLNPDGTTIEYTPNDLYTNCVDPVACDPVVPADCFQYESCGQDDVCVWADVCVEVAPSVPQPEDDAVVTTEGTAVTLDVLANDVSPAEDPLLLGTFTQPQNGLARLNPDGTTIEYTPNDLYTNCPDPIACDPVVPADCFKYESCDQDDVCVWADVCVEVAPAAPQPEDDAIATTEGTAVDIDVLANDEGVDGGPVRVGTFTQPQNGLARLNPDSTTIEYTPNDLYTNCPDAVVCDPVVPADCFQYESCRSDMSSVCTWANVCVEVTPPTLPCGMSREQRAEEILFILLDVSTPTLLSDLSTPQGRAFRWIVDEDEFYVCPSDNTCDVVQRYVLAVMYFSTNGNNWFQCSGNPAASDDCGSDFPFDAGQSRFLAPVTECDWAGIRCSENLCVTEIEFELNNLVGTIPEELGRLPLLEVLGMERGGLSSTIPSVLGQLTNLYFLDLDYNALTGTIPTEISALTELEQLDLNDNRLTGNIEAITTLTKVFFLQLHNNAFTGTVPPGLGSFSELGAATLHSNRFTGSIAPEICALRDTFGGPLLTLSADCDPAENVEITCDCCTECRDV